ncbi:Hypothetical protein LUCI_0212 [Lucifera butyrica]|uniref:Uncharacterized protein n=1 Tax=Lucifera butyrica TaxID=1351585 RepID=A0A498QXX3_9FIRM|nr:hypothetical protein [Lucifera butyrica]VBB05006.1 Hypothetical protein LUCI_0212 [Lucifera butyrica]
MKIKLIKKVTSGLAIGCFLISLGALALAADRQEGPGPGGPGFMEAGRPDLQIIRQHISDGLARLVKAGTITQDQADKVLNFLQEKDRQREAEMEKVMSMSPEERQAYFQQHEKKRPDFVGELKTAAGLSASQAEAVAEAVRPPRPEQRISEDLAKLVKTGTITQDQADKVLSFFREKESQRRAEMEKVRSMSPEERQAYFQQHEKKRPDFVGELKTAAGLSANQAEAVAEAVRPPRPEQRIGEDLAKLVKTGTITQDQADKVLSFFREKESQRRAEMEKVRSMSPEERQAYFQQHGERRPDFIGELKKAADLSDTQAKAVADALQPHHGPFGPMPPMMPNP